MGQSSEALRNSLKNMVAEPMSEAVVHVLEVVDVQEKYANTAVFEFCPFDRRIEEREEMAAVGKAGQRVDLRQFLQLECTFGDLRFEKVVLVACCLLRDGQL